MYNIHSFGLRKIVGVIKFRQKDQKGGPENHLIPIGTNAFRTTNFRSRFAMRGAEIHGNTHRDSILSIVLSWAKNVYLIK